MHSGLKENKMGERKMSQSKPFDVKKTANGMEYYKVQSNILNFHFLPKIRFERDMREQAVTTPTSRNMERRKLSSQTKNTM